jgi:hypothetical protein
VENKKARPQQGSIVWVHGPDPDSLPFMACIVYYGAVSDTSSIYAPLIETVEIAMVHNDEHMATADDLIYWPKDHGHNESLVVQTRLSAKCIPMQFIGNIICTLNAEALREIHQMMDGTRRTTYRTGVLVRSENEFRWDFVLEQKQQLDEFLESIDWQSLKFWENQEFWEDNPNAIEVGQIRSIGFTDEEWGRQTRFVLVTSISSEDSPLVQVMLLGSSVDAGINDVCLHEFEKPSFSPLAETIQTDLRFPVLREHLGPVFSTIAYDTRILLYKMSNYSGRDVSRMGINRDNQENWFRQEYLREEMETVKAIISTSFKPIISK